MPVNKCLTLDHFNQRYYIHDSTDTDSICPVEDSIRAAHGEENVDSWYFDEHQPANQQTQEHLDAFVAEKAAEGYTAAP
jgi:hypothetical protein